MTGGGVESKWFKGSWAFLVLLSLGVHRVAKMEEPFWGDAVRWDLLDDIFTWIALVGTVALIVWKNVVNWRIGPRYFWRRWDKWSSAFGFGGLVLAAFVVFQMIFKPEATLNVGAIWTCIAVVVSSAVAIKIIARYMFNRLGKDVH